MVLDKNSMQLTKTQITSFQECVLSNGKQLYRDMPWRSDTNPYNILLSEIMLQQTQVTRVIQKFAEFKDAFPTLQDLAQADFHEVLAHWSGLGYNRRARFLHQTAKQIEKLGRFPDNQKFLESCPGIGKNTAASILVYAYNHPLTFLETNVRTVLIFHFLQDSSQKVEESLLQSLAEQTLYYQNPREWYWSLMDYGTFIKKTEGNYNRKSKMHTVQSKFEGSFRQKRAAVLRCLLSSGPLLTDELSNKMGYDIDITEQIIESLCKDSMICLINNRYCINE